MSRDTPVTIIGNVARDLELKFSASGTAWTTLGVAVNEQKKDGDRWVDDGVSFFDVKLFGQIAENAAESLSKGTRVIVKGTLKQESWETDGGEKRSKVVVMADAIGPELRFATAEVVKAERSGGTRQQESAGFDDGFG